MAWTTTIQGMVEIQHMAILGILDEIGFAHAYLHVQTNMHLRLRWCFNHTMEDSQNFQHMEVPEVILVAPIYWFQSDFP